MASVASETDWNRIDIASVCGGMSTFGARSEAASSGTVITSGTAITLEVSDLSPENRALA
jgi:hypothetical protein